MVIVRTTFLTLVAGMASSILYMGLTRSDPRLECCAKEHGYSPLQFLQYLQIESLFVALYYLSHKVED